MPSRSIHGEKRDVLTVKEAATLLKISPSTLYNYVRQGKLPGIRVRGRWQIKKESVQAMRQSWKASAQRAPSVQLLGTSEDMTFDFERSHLRQLMEMRSEQDLGMFFHKLFFPLLDNYWTEISASLNRMESKLDGLPR